MSELSVVVGLGNPGREYDKTRHNAGFMFVDRLAAEAGEGGRTVAWKKKHGAEIASVEWRGRKLLLVKPQKFMNLSGGPVAELLNFLKLGLDELIVAHDEIDLPLGTLRIKSGGGDGGHNGLASISSEIGGFGYTRIRIGVGRPDGIQGEGRVASWVLSPFSKEESVVVAGVLQGAIEALSVILENGLAAAQNRFNR